MSGLAELDLDKPMEEELCAFSQNISDALGENLVSTILYGVWAKDLARPSDRVNLMIVLREVAHTDLNAIATFVRQGIHGSRISVTIVSEQEVERSTDVFPVKFLDMQHFHTVLHGRNLFDELLIGADNLRLRCEQETRNVLLRLRSQYVYKSRDPDGLGRVLLSATSSFLATLNAFFFLVNGSFQRTEAEIVQQASEMLKLDSDVLLRLVEIKGSSRTIDSTEMPELHESLMATVKRAAEVIDQFTPHEEAEQ